MSFPGQIYIILGEIIFLTAIHDSNFLSLKNGKPNSQNLYKKSRIHMRNYSKTLHKPEKRQIFDNNLEDIDFYTKKISNNKF